VRASPEDIAVLAGLKIRADIHVLLKNPCLMRDFHRVNKQKIRPILPRSVRVLKKPESLSFIDDASQTALTFGPAGLLLEGK
jgi:hypothetical protein